MYCIILIIFIIAYDYEDLYSRLFAHYPYLEEIKAQYITGDSLKLLGSEAGSKLKSCDFYEMSATAEDVSVLCRGCRNLKSLSFCEGLAEGDADAAVQAIVSHCPCIEKLNLNGWIDMTDLSLHRMTTLVGLKELCLAYCPLFSSASIRTLLQCFPSLEKLAFRLNEGSIDDILRCLSHYCPCLKDLYAGGEFVSPDVVIALAQACPRLVRLRILVASFEPDDRVLIAIAACCPHLHTIDLPHCKPSAYTDLGLIALSRGCPDLTLCPIDNDAATDAAILSFAEHCHKLTSIKISNNSRITYTSVCALIKANPSITIITLKHCTMVVEECLALPVQYIPNLSFIRIEECEYLTESCLITLVTRGSLTGMCLTGCLCATDSLIHSLVTHCKKLETVSLYTCPNITDDSIVTLITLAPLLTRLDVRECSGAC